MPPPPIPPSRSEVIYYDAGQTLVTSARVVLDGVTYAMGNVTSVRTFRIEPNRMAPLIFTTLGLIGTLYGLSDRLWLLAIIGIAAVVAGLLIWRSQGPTFTVLLGTAGTETHTQTSPDKRVIDAIVDAISQAIINRG
jgi:hypothetical protein